MLKVQHMLLSVDCREKIYISWSWCGCDEGKEKKKVVENEEYLRNICCRQEKKNNMKFLEASREECWVLDKIRRHTTSTNPQNIYNFDYKRQFFSSVKKQHQQQNDIFIACSKRVRKKE